MKLNLTVLFTTCPSTCTMKESICVTFRAEPNKERRTAYSLEVTPTKIPNSVQYGLESVEDSIGVGSKLTYGLVLGIYEIADSASPLPKAICVGLASAPSLSCTELVCSLLMRIILNRKRFTCKNLLMVSNFWAWLRLASRALLSTLLTMTKNRQDQPSSQWNSATHSLQWGSRCEPVGYEYRPQCFQTPEYRVSVHITNNNTNWWDAYSTPLGECTSRGIPCLLRLSVESGKVYADLVGSSLYFVKVGMVSGHFGTHYWGIEDKRAGKWNQAKSSEYIDLWSSRRQIFDVLNARQIPLHRTCS